MPRRRSKGAFVNDVRKMLRFFSLLPLVMVTLRHATFQYYFLAFGPTPSPPSASIIFGLSPRGLIDTYWIENFQIKAVFNIMASFNEVLNDK